VDEPFEVKTIDPDEICVRSDLSTMESEGGYVDRRYTRQEVLTFILDLMNSVGATPADLSQHAVRLIVREELSNLLDDVGKKVGASNLLQLEKMADAFVGIVDQVARAKAVEAVDDHKDSVNHSYTL
jgi:hypothetical protein